MQLVGKDKGFPELMCCLYYSLQYEGGHKYKVCPAGGARGKDHKIIKGDDPALVIYYSWTLLE